MQILVVNNDCSEHVRSDIILSMITFSMTSCSNIFRVRAHEDDSTRYFKVSEQRIEFT